jgi:hypothetical protein
LAPARRARGLPLATSSIDILSYMEESESGITPKSCGAMHKYF